MRALIGLVLALAAPEGRVEAMLFDDDGMRITDAEVFVGDHRASGMVPSGAHRVRVMRAGVERVGPEIIVRAGALVDLVITWSAEDLVVDVIGADPSEVSRPPTTEIQARTIEIVVKDELTGAPVDGARCFLRGGGQVGATDDAGRATISVPDGDTAISVVHPRFTPRVATITKDATTLDVKLLPAATELDDLEVRAPYVDGALTAAVEEEREQKQVVEVLGTEQMKRAGDGDAAAALKRVTGLSVVGGRYVYVRGLGERYSSTLLDGATLPSPEPERRVVPLDMFPTGILSSVVVQKTWSPDLPGDFGGGVIELRTRRIPEQRFLDVSLGLAGALGTTFNTGPMVRGGALDFLGFDDGTRALPSALKEASRDQPLAEKNSLTNTGYTPEQLEAFGESLQNTYTPSPQLLLPSGSAGVALGDRFEIGEAKLGVIGSASYSHEWTRSLIERNSYAVGADGALEPLETSTAEGLDRSVGLGGLLAVGAELGGQHLQSTTFIQRITDEEIRAAEGFDRDAETDVRDARIHWVERTLFSQRLAGEHAIAALSSEIAWRYGFSAAVRDEPDLREIRYERDPNSGVFLLSDRPQGNQRMFSRLDETAHDGAIAYRIALPALVADDEDAIVEVGVGGFTKSRAVDTRRYTFRFGPASGDAKLRAQSAEDLFSPENISANNFELAESTRKTDNYGGTQTIVSTWAKADWPLPYDLSMSGGARVEAAHIETSTFELFNAGATPVNAAIDALDLLPALSLTWGLTESMQLRLAGSMTVSRPELRELSPAIYTDVDGGRTRFGNPELQPGSIAHADARWEWYLSQVDVVSAAVFAKSFTNPIESIVTAGADTAITYANAPGAQNFGVEIEARMDLGRVHPGARGFFVGGNGALVYSQVQLPADGVHTTRERPLEGQSPWVGNLDVGYDNDELGLRVTALYNVFGPRIREVGVLGAPDVYEQPFHQVDVVVSQKLPWGLSLSAKAQNVLDGTTLLTQGGEVLERTKRGPAFSLGLGWSP